MTRRPCAINAWANALPVKPLEPVIRIVSADEVTDAHFRSAPDGDPYSRPAEKSTLRREETWTPGRNASRRRPRRRKSAAQPRLTQWRGGYEVMGRTEARSALWQNTTFTLTVSRSEAMSSIGVQTPEVSEMAYENLKP